MKRKNLQKWLQLAVYAITLEHVFGALRVQDAVEELAGDELTGWSGSALSERVLDLAALADRVRAELVRTVGQWDAVQAWAEDGAVSAPSWLAARSPMTRPDAAALVRMARVARDYERVGKALAVGDISVPHVESLARAERHRSEVFADHEDVLVDLAPTLTPGEFSTAAQHWAHAADDMLARRDPYERFEHRYLEIAWSFEGGAHLDGFLDPEGAATLTACIDAYTDPPDAVGVAGPRRSAAQRRADALVQIARLALDHPEAVSSRARVNLDAVVDVSAIAAISGIGAPLDDPCVTAWSRHELGGRPASHALVERLACDASVGRVVMRGASEVLDLGRRSRVVSGAQRRALRRRDRHCRFPGCDRPADWADAHHIVSWLRGGNTDLDNLVLLCRRHHVLCHEGGWQLRRDPDGCIDATPPEGSRHPPRDGRPP